MVLVSTDFSLASERYNLRKKRPLAFTAVPWFFESDVDDDYEVAHDDADDDDYCPSPDDTTDSDPEPRPPAKKTRRQSLRPVPSKTSAPPSLPSTKSAPARKPSPSRPAASSAPKPPPSRSPSTFFVAPEDLNLTLPVVPARSQRQPDADPACPSDRTLKNRERAKRRRGRDKEKRTAGINLEKLKDAVTVEANIDVTAHGTGKSGFVSPRKYRKEHADKNSRALADEDVVLHPNLHPAARRLVEDENMRYIRPGDAPIHFTDTNDIIFAALIAPFRDKDFAALHSRLYDHFVDVQRKLGRDNSAANPRGKFSRVQFGTSFGGGQTRPTPISNSRRTQKIMRDFFALADVRRWVQYITKSGQASFPDTMKIYSELNKKLGLNAQFCRDRDDPDEFNWFFAATTLNLGPQVVTDEHRDALNLPPGVCVITALGPFNPQTGGHFVMREPGIVLEFRPGDVLFVMSSVITHFNIPLASSDEKRASWTFYTAGGLFRWEVAGCHTLKLLNPLQRAAYAEKAAVFLNRAWNAFMTPDELSSYWKHRTR